MNAVPLVSLHTWLPRSRPPVQFDRLWAKARPVSKWNVAAQNVLSVSALPQDLECTDQSFNEYSLHRGKAKTTFTCSQGKDLAPWRSKMVFKSSTKPCREDSHFKSFSDQLQLQLLPKPLRRPGWPVLRDPNRTKNWPTTAPRIKTSTNCQVGTISASLLAALYIFPERGKKIQRETTKPSH